MTLPDGELDGAIASERKVFSKMDLTKSESQGKELACRILHTVQLIRTIAGYIAIWQTDYQLVSPLIPKTMVYDITFYWIKPCLFIGLALLISLWLYFFGKKTATIVLSAASILAFEIWMRYFIA